MKRIPLTKGREALVDDQDYEYLMQWKWCATKGGKRDSNYYACRKGGGPLRRMHHEVAERMGLHANLFQEVDHWNGRSLDNRRQNLRLATRPQNSRNRGRNRNNKSGYKGVCWHEAAQKWKAAITVNYRCIYLGVFSSKIEAARAYNEAALTHFGAFAVLNSV